MRKPLQVSLSFASAWLAAMVVAAISHVAYWPSRLDGLDASSLFAYSVLGALWAAGLSLVALAAVSFWRRPTPAWSALIAASAFLALVVWRASKPWQYYGSFPGEMILRDFSLGLPISLSAGLAFGLVLRRVGPNNSSKPTPLRGAA